MSNNALGAKIAREALALVGTPFRLQGRDPGLGLDCIGLVAVSLGRARACAAPGTPLGYRLRNTHVWQFYHHAELAGLQKVCGKWLAGDIAHTQPGPAQDHLLIAVGDGRFVEAHAGLREVVITCNPSLIGLAHHWRAG